MNKREIYFKALEAIKPEELVWKSYEEDNILKWEWAGARGDSIGGKLFFRIDPVTNVFAMVGVEIINGSNIDREPIYMTMIEIEERSRNMDTIIKYLLEYMGA